VTRFGRRLHVQDLTTAAALEVGKIGLNSVLPNPNSECFTSRTRRAVLPKNAEAVNIDPLPLPWHWRSRRTRCSSTWNCRPA